MKENKENKEIIKSEKKEKILGSPFMPQSFSEKLKLAEVLYKSGFCPKEMNTVEKVFVSLQYGHELGLSPMIAVQNIAVVNGRPSLMTTVMMGIIRASGKVVDLKEEEILDENKIIGFEVTGKRKDTGNTVYKGRFTLEDAEKAGLVGKDGSVIKDNWKYPRDMLLFRAQSRFGKNCCPELFAGLLTKEEAENLEPIDVTPPKNNESLLKDIKANMDNEDNKKPEIIDAAGQELNENGSKKEKSELLTQNEIEEKTGSITSDGSGKIGKKIYPPDHIQKNQDAVKKRESAKAAKKNNSTGHFGEPGVGVTKDLNFENCTGANEEKEDSDFDPIESFGLIFGNNRAKKIKDLMSKEDTKYFHDLVRSDAEKYTKRLFDADIETIKKYEKDFISKKEFIKKGGQK